MASASMRPTAPTPSPARPRAGSAVRAAGLLLALGSAFAFATSGAFVKPLLADGWSLGAVLLARIGVGALILSPALVSAIRADRRFLRRHGGLILAFGATGVAGCQLFYYAAIQRMPVAVALLIEYLAPVLLVALVWARTRRAPARVVVLGTAAALFGLLLVVDPAGASADPLGVVLALGAAVSLAAYFVISARTDTDVPPLALAAGGLLSGAAIIGVLVLVGVLPFAVGSGTVVLAGVDVAPWVPLLWVALVATACAYALGVLGARRLGSRVASFAGLTEVLFAMLVAWLVLAETPTIVQAAGGALIVAGVVLVRRDRTGE